MRTDNVDDCAELEQLTLPAVAKLISARAEDGRKSFTWIGPVLLFLNSYHLWKAEFSVYKQRTCSTSELASSEPHIYAIGQQTYNNVVKAPRSALPIQETILISGETGSGKTESCRKVLEQWAFCSCSVETRQALKAARVENSETGVHSILGDANVVLEAFGSAKTVNNKSSSRYARWVDVEVDEEGRILQSQIWLPLVVSSRVTSFAKDNQNFMFLHTLVDAVKTRGAALLPRLKSAESLTESAFLKDERDNAVIDALIPPHLSFDATSAAITNVGIDEGVQRDIRELCSAILALGAVHFEDGTDDDEVARISSSDVVIGAVEYICEVLQVPELELRTRLTSSSVLDTHRLLSQREAKQLRDAFARSLYEALFAYILRRVNECLQRGKQQPTVSSKSGGSDLLQAAHPSNSSLADGLRPSDGSKVFAAQRVMSVLDAFGFESEECNTLEQLCINYTNEKLLQLCLDATARMDDALVIHPDCNTRSLLSGSIVRKSEEKRLMKPSERVDRVVEGLRSTFANLRDAGLTGSHSTGAEGDNRDRAFLVKVDRGSGAGAGKAGVGRSCVRVNDFSKLLFTVSHTFAEVQYNADAMVFHDKAAVLTQDMQSLLSEKSDLCKSQFALEVWREGELCARKSLGVTTGGVVGSAAMSNSSSSCTSRRFVSRTEQILNRALRGNIKFVRCIRSNKRQVPLEFDHNYIVQQLNYAGINELLPVLKAGLPFRITFEKFLEKVPPAVITAIGLKPKELVHSACLAAAKRGILKERVALSSCRVFFKDASATCELQQALAGSSETGGEISADCIKDEWRAVREGAAKETVRRWLSVRAAKILLVRLRKERQEQIEREKREEEKRQREQEEKEQANRQEEQQRQLSASQLIGAFCVVGLRRQRRAVSTDAVLGRKETTEKSCVSTPRSEFSSVRSRSPSEVEQASQDGRLAKTPADASGASKNTALGTSVKKACAKSEAVVDGKSADKRKGRQTGDENKVRTSISSRTGACKLEVISSDNSSKLEPGEVAPKSSGGNNIGSLENCARTFRHEQESRYGRNSRERTGSRFRSASRNRRAPPVNAAVQESPQTKEPHKALSDKKVFATLPPHHENKKPPRNAPPQVSLGSVKELAPSTVKKATPDASSSRHPEAGDACKRSTSMSGFRQPQTGVIASERDAAGEEGWGRGADREGRPASSRRSPSTSSYFRGGSSQSPSSRLWWLPRDPQRELEMASDWRSREPETKASAPGGSGANYWWDPVGVPDRWGRSPAGGCSVNAEKQPPLGSEKLGVRRRSASRIGAAGRKLIESSLEGSATTVVKAAADAAEAALQKPRQAEAITPTALATLAAPSAPRPAAPAATPPAAPAATPPAAPVASAPLERFPAHQQHASNPYFVNRPVESFLPPRPPQMPRFPPRNGYRGVGGRDGYAAQRSQQHVDTWYGGSNEIGVSPSLQRATSAGGAARRWNSAKGGGRGRERGAPNFGYQPFGRDFGSGNQSEFYCGPGSYYPQRPHHHHPRPPPHGGRRPPHLNDFHRQLIQETIERYTGICGQAGVGPPPVALNPYYGDPGFNSYGQRAPVMPIAGYGRHGYYETDGVLHPEAVGNNTFLYNDVGARTVSSNAAASWHGNLFTEFRPGVPSHTSFHQPVDPLAQIRGASAPEQPPAIQQQQQQQQQQQGRQEALAKPEAQEEKKPSRQQPDPAQGQKAERPPRSRGRSFSYRHRPPRPRPFSGGANEEKSVSVEGSDAAPRAPAPVNSGTKRGAADDSQGTPPSTMADSLPVIAAEPLTEGSAQETRAGKRRG